MHSGAFRSEERSGPAHAALNLIEDQGVAAVGGRLSERLEQSRGNLPHATFALNGLDDAGSHVGKRPRVEDHLATGIRIQPRDGYGGGFDRPRRSVDVIDRQEDDRGTDLLPRSPIFLVVGELNRSNGFAVEGALEREEDRWTRERRPRELFHDTTERGEIVEFRYPQHRRRIPKQIGREHSRSLA